jgi:hypothetical protein
VDKIKVEVFLSVPPCSGGIAVTRLLDEMQRLYGDRMDVEVHRGPVDEYQERGISACPAIIIGDLVRFQGVAPDKESFIGALRECGL